MQDITSDICNNVAIGTFEVPNTGTLVDKRDGKTYTVARLKMNPEGTQATCWMTQNLALVLSTSKALTNADTDLNSVTSWTPSRNTLTNVPQFASDNNAPYSYSPNNASYGIYYNWSAAVASNNTSSMTTQYTNAPDSICPRGWRLPKAYDGSASNMPNEYGNLFYSYGLISSPTVTAWVANGFTKVQQAPISVVKSGIVSATTSVVLLGEAVVYHSSTVSALYNGRKVVYVGSFNANIVAIPGEAYRVDGPTVRCVLR